MSTLKRNIIFATGNKNKLAEVQAILSGPASSITISSLPLDLPELQGDPEYVALEKCKLAAKLVNGPVMTEDTSLCFLALNDLPGVYIRPFLEKIGLIGLNNLLSAYEDKRAYAQCIFAHTDGPNCEPKLFSGRCYGKIVLPQGDTSFGWDPIFMPDVSNGLTFAQMDKQEKNSISHRAIALGKLREYFEKEK